MEGWARPEGEPASAHPRPGLPTPFAPPPPLPPFRPLERRAHLTVGLLALALLADVVAVLFWLGERGLLARLDRGELVSDSELLASDTRVGLVAIVQIVLFTIVATAFLAWFFRAYSNLEALGASDRRFGRRWAVGGWFVPVLALWRPKQIANDIWRASEPEAPREQRWEWRDRTPPRLLALWWGGWIVVGSLYNVAGRGSLSANDVDALLGANTFWLVTESASAVLTVVAILVVLRLTERQEARARRHGLVREEVPTALWRRGTAWATGLAAALALGVQAVIVLAVALSSTSEVASDASGPARTVSAPRSDAGLIFRDDFENPRSGWLNEESGTNSVGYVDGEYQISIEQKDFQQWTYVLLVDPRDGVQVEIDAALREGKAEDGYGIGCWTEDEGSYYGIVFLDRYYSIVREASPTGEQELLANGRTDGRTVRGTFDDHTLSFECVGGGSSAARLRLVVNGQELATATDPSPLGPVAGVGVVAASLSGRTVAGFDDIEVRSAD